MAYMSKPPRIRGLRAGNLFRRVLVIKIQIYVFYFHMYIYIYIICSLYTCTIYISFYNLMFRWLSFFGTPRTMADHNPRFKQPGFWRSFCCNPQRWQGPEIIHGTEKKRAFEKDVCQSLGDVYRVHLSPSWFFYAGVGLFESSVLFFCWVLVVYSSIQKSWLAMSGVIKLAVFWGNQTIQIFGNFEGFHW